MRTAAAVTLTLALLPAASLADGDPSLDTATPAITIKEGDCPLLAHHSAAPGVTATATDAYGRPVAPAEELGSFRPPALRFIIQARTIERETWRSEPALMELSLDLETGEITSGGQPIPGLSEADLVKACNENLSEPRSAP